MRRRASVLAATLLLPAGPVMAACTDPATCGCTVSTTGLAFGLYDPQSGQPLDSVGILSMTCNSADAANSTATIGLGRGGGTDGARRQMRGDGGALAYDLFSDPARAIVWGDEAGGVVAAFPPDGGTRTLRIYGRIPARQPARVGSYSDTVTIAVIY